jgi:hypothetical protein
VQSGRSRPCRQPLHYNSMTPGTVAVPADKLYHA